MQDIIPLEPLQGKYGFPNGHARDFRPELIGACPGKMSLADGIFRQSFGRREAPPVYPLGGPMRIGS
jgi:hypothetical protein